MFMSKDGKHVDGDTVASDYMRSPESVHCACLPVLFRD